MRSLWGRKLILTVAVLLAIGACATSEDPDASSAAGTPTSARDAASEDVPEGRDVVVTSITDGDTFRAGDERVRLTGIDTPEVSGAVECYGREATEALARLIPPGSEVRLVLDVDAEDRYDRTLAYVYRLPGGEFVNLSLARDGFAQPLTIPPNVAHAEELVAAAGQARTAERGLWSACAGELDGGEVPSSTTAGAAPSGDGCDPAYPDGCIPPSPPDLDCGDIPDRNFTVLAPDPHHFDGGGDGRGCEGR